MKGGTNNVGLDDAGKLIMPNPGITRLLL